MIASRQNKDQELAHADKILHNPEFYWNSATLSGKKGSLRRAEWIMSRTQMNRDKKVLEVGCGTGFFSEVFIKTGAELHCIDIADVLLEKAKERCGDQANILNADIENLPFANASFDAVVGIRILHHLDMEAAVKEIIRVLKPGGCIAFCEPNMLNPQIMIQKNIPWIKKIMGDTPDETAFFKWKIKKFLKDKGFLNVEANPFDFLHPWIPSSLAVTAEKVGYAIERIPLLKEIAGSLKISAVKPSR